MKAEDWENIGRVISFTSRKNEEPHPIAQQEAERAVVALYASDGYMTYEFAKGVFTVTKEHAARINALKLTKANQAGFQEQQEAERAVVTPYACKRSVQSYALAERIMASRGEILNRNAIMFHRPPLRPDLEIKPAPEGASLEERLAVATKLGEKTIREFKKAKTRLIRFPKMRLNLNPFIEDEIRSPEQAALQTIMDNYKDSQNRFEVLEMAYSDQEGLRFTFGYQTH
jgi:hypothetical protein